MTKCFHSSTQSFATKLVKTKEAVTLVIFLVGNFTFARSISFQSLTELTGFFVIVICFIKICYQRQKL